MITLWDKVKIGETDDISKLLAGREYFAGNTADKAEELSSNAVPEKQLTAPPPKKKKRATRALKITNTHMKDQVGEYVNAKLMDRVSISRKTTSGSRSGVHGVAPLVRLALYIGQIALLFTFSRMLYELAGLRL
jgi:hypothetical protein